MERAKQLGAKALPITGNIEFYGKSGFVVASTKGVHYHAESRENEVPYFLIKELVPGVLDGISGVFYAPEGYKRYMVDVEEFDKNFPPKVKMRTPTQIF